MGLKPFFCFYGGKWRAAPKYDEPEHDRLVEPFAGAAGYATRHHRRQVTLVERDPVIAGLWKYLVRATPSEIMSIPSEVPGTVDDLPICQEARWLVGFWCNKGASAPMKSPSKWMRSRVRPASYWGPEIRQRIANQVSHIRHWKIVEGSYDSVPIFDPKTTWFVDPPYQFAGQHYRYRISDYDALAEWCRALRGQVIVCVRTWGPSGYRSDLGRGSRARQERTEAGQATRRSGRRRLAVMRQRKERTPCP